jgi:ribonuclease G
MEASFVDIGLEKNGFLYVDEIVVPELEGKRHARRIQDLVERGQQVLVQAVKDPMGTKGARLTTEISLPGRFLVYTPFGEGIGVSRRLEDDERERLKAICKELELPEGGVIVRTAAEGASHEELAGDIELLGKLWAAIQGRASRADAPSLVYQEAELPLRIVRDLFIRDFERVVVDHERTHRRIVGYLNRTSPELASRVELYDGPEPLMARSGVDEAVRSTLDKRVDLPSGGYLIFDYAEAFTVIDVNTGRFVGARGKGATGRLEDTITKNNLEAVVEVVRQLRLRDIGGIIVIDFIDMANPKNRQLVEEALQRELERDRTKTYVVEISPLGLVEMTRQNVTDGPREIITCACPTCGGDGIVVSPETHAVEVERRLRAVAAGSLAEAFLVEANDRVAGILIGRAGDRLSALEEETGKLFAFEPRPDAPLGYMDVAAQGAWDDVQPQGLPVAIGQELVLKLEQRDPASPADALARLDGYVVNVAGGGQRIGRRMKVKIRRATRTAAYAVLTSAKPVEAPVLAEDMAEAVVGAAEKPKRPRRRKGVTAPEPVAEAAAEEAPPVEEAAPAEAAAEGEAPADEAAATPKKKTRRGTRGGRGRKKKAAAAGENGAAAEAEAAEVVAALVEPEEPEPAAGEPEEAAAAAEEAAEPGAEEEPKRKRRRRGSRGGRGRKRSTASADGAGPDETGEAEPGEPEAPVEDEPAAAAPVAGDDEVSLH